MAWNFPKLDYYIISPVFYENVARIANAVRSLFDCQSLTLTIMIWVSQFFRKSRRRHCLGLYGLGKISFIVCGMRKIPLTVCGMSKILLTVCGKRKVLLTVCGMRKILLTVCGMLLTWVSSRGWDWSTGRSQCGPPSVCYPLCGLPPIVRHTCGVQFLKGMCL